MSKVNTHLTDWPMRYTSTIDEKSFETSGCAGCSGLMPVLELSAFAVFLPFRVVADFLRLIETFLRLFETSLRLVLRFSAVSVTRQVLTKENLRITNKCHPRKNHAIKTHAKRYTPDPETRRDRPDHQR